MQTTTHLSQLPRRVAWGLIGLGLALSLASYPMPALAQASFVSMSPSEDSIVSLGDLVTILWTGGDPAWSVNVLLIEATAGWPFAVVAGVSEHIPNRGMVNWMFPSRLPPHN